MNGKRVGVIVEVNNQYSRVGVYSLLNDSSVIWQGELLSGIKVGSYLTINQNDIKIIATVFSEKVIDQQNSVGSIEFDNRFHKNSINRIIDLQIKGVIVNGRFMITGKYTPMVGNEVTLTTKSELDLIYGLNTNDETIKIGRTVLEDYPVNISINGFFASHIGIFGNTGSGKSNTLHKLYLELLRSKYKNSILNKSRIFIIDFNGEYCNANIFGLNESERQIIDINTRKPKNKVNIKSSYIFDINILSLLFDARPATQVPFLKKAISKFLENNDKNKFASLEVGLLKNILKSIKGNVGLDFLDEWLNAARSIGVDDNILKSFDDISSEVNYGNQRLLNLNGIILVENAEITINGEKLLCIDELRKTLEDIYSQASELKKFLIFLEFQRVFEIKYNSTKTDYINPLFNRIRPTIHSLEKVIDVVDDNKGESFKPITIISLVNANSDMKRLIPMLLSKMIYVEHKSTVSGKVITNTTHLIIDEAHNILNSQYKNIGDDWLDYRLSIFEEIIKEGRKFGFYLTLASQRPADISPTIMSQLHNYIIHKLVNDKDLKMLENTMPTLDLFTYKMIPMLGQGEGIITGTSFKNPVIVKIDKEEQIRPNSDDVVLSEIWN